MNRLNEFRELLPGQDLTFLAGTEYVYHCHHYNLFHDQTIDDGVGEEASWQLRVSAAHEAFRGLLQRLFQASNADTPSEKLALAAEVFAWMGHGRIDLSLAREQGSARASHLHYGFSWRDKYGEIVKRTHAADAVAAGFLAATSELAYGLPAGSVSCKEESCVAAKAAECRFTTQSGEARSLNDTLTMGAVSELVSPPTSGIQEETISQIADGLREFLRGVQGDQHGLIPAFGVFVSMHLSDYYNRTAYEMVHSVERVAPAGAGVAEALLREAGHVCAFNTFGNILLSPEWEGLVGAPSGDPLETIVFCAAIARGLGFGHWTVQSFEAGKRFELVAPCCYDTPFYLRNYGQSQKPRSYFLQGAAQAMMVLAHRVPWTERPRLTQEFYANLFRTKIPWATTQTRCVTQGHPICEVVVE